MLVKNGGRLRCLPFLIQKLFKISLNYAKKIPNEKLENLSTHRDLSTLTSLLLVSPIHRVNSNLCPMHVYSFQAQG